MGRSRVSGRYPIPTGRSRVEEEIKKSRFITTLGAVSSIDEASGFVDEVRSEFSDASHNCWAYLVGPPGTTTTVGMSDDGEPHFTAGRPIRNVLVHSGLGDIAAVVTRYWGGTKLGKGGLVRAYSGGVQLALQSCAVGEKIDWADFEVSFAYAVGAAFKHTCPAFEAEILAEDYSEKVLFKLRLPSEKMEGLKDALVVLTNGKIVFG